MIPPNLLKKIQSITGRTFALKNDKDSNLKLLELMFPRLELHACTLTGTISLGYHGISLSFHAISSLCYFTFPVQFQNFN